MGKLKLVKQVTFLYQHTCYCSVKSSFAGYYDFTLKQIQMNLSAKKYAGCLCA